METSLQKIEKGLTKYADLNQYEKTALAQLPENEKKVILHAREKKFKDYDEHDKRVLAKTIGSIMLMLQIKNIPDPEKEREGLYYTLTIKFLISEFPQLTIDEFIQAMYLGIKTIENDDERHFHSFGVDVISKYINKYLKHTKDIKFKFYLEMHKAKELAEQKTLTDKDKKIIELRYHISVIDYFVKRGEVVDLSDGFYNFIKNNKKLAPLLGSIKRKEAIEQARQRIIEEDERNIINIKGTLRKRELLKEIEKITKGNDIATEKYVNSRAKRIYCETVLKQINIDELKKELETKLKTVINATH